MKKVISEYLSSVDKIAVSLPSLIKETDKILESKGIGKIDLKSALRLDIDEDGINDLKIDPDLKSEFYKLYHKDSREGIKQIAEIVKNTPLGKYIKSRGYRFYFTLNHLKGSFTIEGDKYRIVTA